MTVFDVLLLEDSDRLRNMLAQQMTQWGLSVQPVSDVWSALDVVRERSFDLFVVVCFLPGLTGLRFVRTLREENLVGQGSVLGMSDKVVEEVAIRAGMHAFLKKPFTPVELEDAIRLLLPTWRVS